MNKLKAIGAAVLSVIIGILTLSFLRPRGNQGKADKDLKTASEDARRVSEDIAQVQEDREVLKNEEIVPTDDKSEDFWDDKL